MQGHVFQREYLKSIQPFDGAHDMLARVYAAGQCVVLASSASKGDLAHYVDLLDARQLVTATTSADDVEHTKPAPDLLAVALHKVAPLGPTEVIMVGDAPYDVQSAAKCGISTVALRSGGFSNESLLEAGAMTIYDDVAALHHSYAKSPLAR